MARKSTLGQKSPQTGNKVSHSNRKTRREWLPNIQKKSLYSVALNRHIRVTIPTCTLRSVDRAGGIDNYLLSEPTDRLSRTLRRLQTLIRNRERVAG